ncbi:unnamed protein product [Adineta steineri]|uniref:ABC1 atypical kinase-like domain-containing protein n=1 Tax=Adineta steineri TaxID=433720 RepID=A0A819DER4_9BILA|nr:unnamed protein product [Adineta steineri]
MSHNLSDAGRFIRGLTKLSRQIVNEATRADDPRRRSPSVLEPLLGLVSNGLTHLSGINISNTISKTAWKSSVLVRQTGIAATNTIRTSSSPSTVYTTSIPPHLKIDSPIVTTTTTVVKDKIPIPKFPEIDSSTITTTTTLAKDKIPIPKFPEIDSSTTTHPQLDTSTVKPTTNFIRDKSPIATHPKLDSTTPIMEQKFEPLISIKKLDSTTSSTNIDSSKVTPTFFTPSTVDDSSTPLTIEENQNLVSSPPPPSPTNSEAQARAVPTSRIGRLASFGSLAAGLGVGALGSMVRRSVGLEQASSQQSLSPYLSKANAERIVDTLCKVRGAALKLGQMISIQDNFLVQDDIQKIFERVRQKADFMPLWQMNEVMTNDFGTNWRDEFQEFQDRPFAAASIGQVHYGVLKNSKQRVAIKIQYPGVGKSIESDINNLITLLNFWNILPRGLYIESVIKVAKRELNWEVDYVREAEWGRRFQNWLSNYPIYRIPDIIDNLSSKNVLTTSFFDGITLDNAINEDQVIRDRIGTAILELCLLELFKFKAMQTDPNWSNFLFNPANKTIGLIDFGSSRDFSAKFIDNYLKIIRASADNDRERIKELSIEGGFLTGYETREMVDAHVNAVMLLGEGFRTEQAFDFGSQNTTHSIHKLIPTMLKHRLTPPPEDSYSLHRKMSGAFLLCTKLRSKVYCKPIFERIWREYNAS